MTACSKCGQPRPGKSDAFEYRLPEYGESFGIIGVTQHGKSSWAKAWVKYLLSKGYSVIVWDPADEWHVNARGRRFCKPGPLQHSVTVSELLRDPRKHLSKKRISLAVRPDDIYADEKTIAEQFTEFVQWVRRATPEGVPLFFVIDECNLLLKHAGSALSDIAERWAKEEIVPCFVGQRWTHFSPDVRAQLAWLVAFKQVKESDLRFLRTEVGSDFAAALPTLEPGAYRVANLRQASKDVLSELGLSTQHQRPTRGRTQENG